MPSSTTTKTEMNVSDVWSLVPDASAVDAYAGREVHGIEDLDLIHKASELQHNVLVVGPTGSAKTTMVRAYAAREGLPFYSVPMNGAVDLSQMLGKWIPTADGHFVWIDGPVTTIVREGGVLLLDELNYAPAKIMAALYGLLDARRVLTLLDHEGEVVRAHPKLTIVAAMNKGSEYQGIRPLSAALANRFSFQIPFGYDRDVEETLVARMPILLDLAKKLRDAFDVGDLKTPISTNRLMDFEDFATDPTLGVDFAIANFVAAFDEDEQPSVKQVLDLHAGAIRSQAVEAGGE